MPVYKYSQLAIHLNSCRNPLSSLCIHAHSITCSSHHYSYRAATILVPMLQLPRQPPIVHCKLCLGRAAAALGLGLLCLFLLLGSLRRLSGLGGGPRLFGGRSLVPIVFPVSDLLRSFGLGSSLGSGLGLFSRRSLVFIVFLFIGLLGLSRLGSSLGGSLGLFGRRSFVLFVSIVFLVILVDLLRLSGLGSSLGSGLGDGLGLFSRRSIALIVIFLVDLLRLSRLGSSPGLFSRRSLILILLLGLGLSDATNVGLGNRSVVIFIVLSLGLLGLFCRSLGLFGGCFVFLLVICIRLGLFTLGLAVSASLLGLGLILKSQHSTCHRPKNHTSSSLSRAALSLALRRIPFSPGLFFSGSCKSQHKQKEARAKTYALKVLGINVRLLHAALDFAPNLVVLPSSVSLRRLPFNNCILQLIVAINLVKVPLAIALVALLVQPLHLLARHASPTQLATAGNLRVGNVPVLPRPAAAAVNLNPGAESYFALGNLDGRLFAHGVLTSGAVVGRRF